MITKIGNEMKNQTKKVHLTEEENKQFGDIMIRLVLGNIKAGSSYEKAKDQAFNRMWNEYREPFVAWLSDNERVKKC